MAPALDGDARRVAFAKPELSGRDEFREGAVATFAILGDDRVEKGSMTVRMEPAFDTRAFRHALGHFPTGVCVVTSRVDGALIGMTVSSFNSLSLDPPLVLFSVDAGAASLPLWRPAEGYAVNVLAENQKDCPTASRGPAQENGKGRPMPRDCSARRLYRASPRCSSAPRGRPMRLAITCCSLPR